MNKQILKICTFNTWFSPYKRQERLNNLIKYINLINPDIICFQELIKDTYNQLKSELSYKYYYPLNINQQNGYGCAIMSKYDFINCNTIYVPSNMHRNIISIDIKINNILLNISNIHFESEFYEKINEIKIKQYKYVSNYLEEEYKKKRNIILCADTNIMDCEEKKFNKIFHNFFDTNNLTNNITNNMINNMSKNMTKQKYTYNTKTNPYILDKTNIIKLRLDRIIYKCDDLFLSNYKLLNKKKLIFSDHYGVLNDFIFKK